MAEIYTSRSLPGSYGGDYTNGAWGSLMNNYAVRFTAGNDVGNSFEGQTFTFSTTVNFPYPGTYTVWAAVDNSGSLSVAGQTCSIAGFNSANGSATSFTSSAGTKSISGSVYNGPGPNYSTNPYGIAFRIEGPDAPPAPTASISVSPSSFIAGASATLSWSSSGVVDSISVTDQSSPATSGSAIVSPISSRTYTITVSNDGGSDSASTTLTVYQPVVANISASQTSIVLGQSTTLTWSAGGDASTASIDQGIGAVVISSSRSVVPTENTTYTYTASGLGGTDSDSVTITVFQIPELDFTINPTINYGDSLSFDVDYRYAGNSVTGSAVYTYRNPTTGGTTTVTETITLPASTSDTSGSTSTETVDLSIPWNNHGPFSILVSITAIGGGGNITKQENVNVTIDTIPDNITVPENRDELPEDLVEAPDSDAVLSNPILINDIDISVEIKANEPIQVRFDDDDPDLNTSWYDVRQI